MEGKDFTALDNLAEKDMQLVVKEYASSYIFNRWLHELGLKIEEKALSIKDLVEIEREAKMYIKDAVKLDFSKFNVLKTGLSSKKVKLMKHIY